MQETSKGCIAIIKRLYNQKRFGGKHIPENVCLRWIKHLPKEEHKEALKDWEKCIKERIVLTKPKPTERHVFLNPKRKKEIEKIVFE